MMRNTTHTTRVRRLVVAAAGLSACLQIGCPIQGTLFRETALPAIQTGVTAIMNGMLEGFFAVIQPEPASAADQ